MRLCWTHSIWYS